MPPLTGVVERNHTVESLDHAIQGAAIVVAISSTSVIQVAKERCVCLARSVPPLPLTFEIHTPFRMQCTPQAIFQGVPAITVDSISPTYSVSCNDFDSLEAAVIDGTACRPDRTQWLANLGYAMWNIDDIRAGNIHRYLFRLGGDFLSEAPPPRESQGTEADADADADANADAAAALQGR